MCNFFPERIFHKRVNFFQEHATFFKKKIFLSFYVNFLRQKVQCIKYEKVELKFGLIYIIVLNSIWHCHKGGLASGLFDVREFCQRKASLENACSPAYYFTFWCWASALQKTHRGEKWNKFRKACFANTRCLPAYCLTLPTLFSPCISVRGKQLWLSFILLSWYSATLHCKPESQ